MSVAHFLSEVISNPETTSCLAHQSQNICCIHQCFQRCRQTSAILGLTKATKAEFLVFKLLREVAGPLCKPHASIKEHCGVDSLSIPPVDFFSAVGTVGPSAVPSFFGGASCGNRGKFWFLWLFAIPSFFGGASCGNRGKFWFLWLFAIPSFFGGASCGNRGKFC